MSHDAKAKNGADKNYNPDLSEQNENLSSSKIAKARLREVLAQQRSYAYDEFTLEQKALKKREEAILAELAAAAKAAASQSSASNVSDTKTGTTSKSHAETSSSISKDGSPETSKEATPEASKEATSKASKEATSKASKEACLGASPRANAENSLPTTEPDNLKQKDCATDNDLSNTSDKEISKSISDSASKNTFTNDSKEQSAQAESDVGSSDTETSATDNDCIENAAKDKECVSNESAVDNNAADEITNSSLDEEGDLEQLKELMKNEPDTYYPIVVYTPEQLKEAQKSGAKRILVKGDLAKKLSTAFKGLGSLSTTSLNTLALCLSGAALFAPFTGGVSLGAAGTVMGTVGAALTATAIAAISAIGLSLVLAVFKGYDEIKLGGGGVELVIKKNRNKDKSDSAKGDKTNADSPTNSAQKAETSKVNTEQSDDSKDNLKSS